MNEELELKQAENMRQLLADWPQIALRMMAVRLMLEHRRITPQQVMQHSGMSKQWVYGTLAPQNVWYGEGKQPTGSYVSLGTAETRLDRLEAFITEITDERGGITASCGCTQAALDILTDELAHPIRAELPYLQSSSVTARRWTR